MNLRLASAGAALAALLLLAGCSSSAGTTTSTEREAPQSAVEEPAQPLDLTGEWTQTNSSSEDSYQEATISGDEIVINWVNEAESTTALYWAGTYNAPMEATDMYTWDSVNDTSQTDTAILASGDSTKTFTYEGGKLKYELAAMGVTMTVEMEQQ
ncbi:hypothetical protein ACFC3F_10135 [Microbacterium sp. NPDC055910]|uniref:hypothetical protein n=1 Tax=Microbacterium sp. NPDC055910 TaxID=3345659 RepID=UPI0035E0E74B